MVVEMIRSPKGKVTAMGAACGLVAGLVAITPAAGYVSTPSAILIGVAAGLVCVFAIELKHKLGYDDALDVVGVHGVGGTLGAILTGALADPAINSAVEGSLKDGRGHLMVVQFQAIGATLAYAGIGTYVLAMIINKVTRLRSSESAEVKGLDHSYHGEQGYVIPGAAPTPATAEKMIEEAVVSEPLLK
jgi:Amt family ammonium transporter